MTGETKTAPGGSDQDATLEYREIVHIPEAPEVMAVAVSSRIPEFWVDQPRVWFIRAEAVLTQQRMGDEAKFDMVVSKLPKEVILRLTEFLTSPPTTNKYSTLKTKLLSMLEDSKTRQIEKVLGEMDLGDTKPSQLLYRMRNTAKDSFPDGTLRIMWQNHLPTTVRAVLVASRETDLDTLASIADDVAEATRSNHVSEVVAQQSRRTDQLAPSTSRSGETAVILAEIAKLSVRMMDLERSRPRQQNYGRNYRGGRSASSRSTSSSRRGDSTGRKKEWLCFYHYRFGPKANKCVQPCAWDNKSEN